MLGIFSFPSFNQTKEHLLSVGAGKKKSEGIAVYIIILLVSDFPQQRYQLSHLPRHLIKWLRINRLGSDRAESS